MIYNNNKLQIQKVFTFYRVVKIQRKVYIAMEALAYFTLNSWIFLNDRFMGLNDVLLNDDRKEFWFRKTEFDVYQYCKQSMMGGRIYLLGEKLEDIEKNNKRGNRYVIFGYTFTLCICRLLLLYRVVFISDYVYFTTLCNTRFMQYCSLYSLLSSAE